MIFSFKCFNLTMKKDMKNDNEIHIYFRIYCDLQNETSIAEQLIKLGPLSVALNAELLQFYHHGVFDPPSFACDPKNLDHGLCLIYISMTSFSTHDL